MDVMLLRSMLAAQKSWVRSSPLLLIQQGGMTKRLHLGQRLRQLRLAVRIHKRPEARRKSHSDLTGTPTGNALKFLLKNSTACILKILDLYFAAR